MPIPTTYLDFNPATIVSPPALGAALTLPLEVADGTQWASGDGNGGLIYREISGHKVVSGNQIVRTPDTAAVPELTFYVVYAGSVTTQLGQNMAACYFNITTHPTDTTRLIFLASGEEFDVPTQSWPKGGRVVLAFSFSVAAVRVFVNGVFDHSLVYTSAYMGATTPTVLPQGDVFRAFVVPSIQSDLEIQALSQELAQTYIYESATVTWDAPAHDGGNPVTGYLVRVSDAGGVTDHDFDADDTRTLDVSYAPPAVVRIMALNAQGPSEAAEVALA